MLHQSPCQQCGVNIEFETEQANEFVDCPSCQKSTRLLIGAPRNTFQRAPAAAGFVHPGDQHKTHWLTISIGGILIIALIVALAVILHQNPGMIGAIGSGGVTIVLGLISATVIVLGVVLAMFWLIFPWMVYSLLKKIEINTRARPPE